MIISQAMRDHPGEEFTFPSCEESDEESLLGLHVNQRLFREWRKLDKKSGRCAPVNFNDQLLRAYVHIARIRISLTHCYQA